MKRFFIALFLSLSFSLFAEPIITADFFNKSPEDAIAFFEKDGWTLTDTPNKFFTMNRIEDDILEELIIFINNNSLISISYERVYIIENQKDLVLAENKMKIFVSAIFNQYEGEFIDEKNFISSDNSLKITYWECPTYLPDQIFAYHCYIIYHLNQDKL